MIWMNLPFSSKYYGNLYIIKSGDWILMYKWWNCISKRYGVWIWWNTWNIMFQDCLLFPMVIGIQWNAIFGWAFSFLLELGSIIWAFSFYSSEFGLASLTLLDGSQIISDDLQYNYGTVSTKKRYVLLYYFFQCSVEYWASFDNYVNLLPVLWSFTPGDVTISSECLFINILEDDVSSNCWNSILSFEQSKLNVVFADASSH